MALIHVAMQGKDVCEAAKELGVSRSALLNVMSGRRKVSAEMAVRIEMAWGYPAVNFLYPQIQEEITAVRKRLTIGRRA